MATAVESALRRKAKRRGVELVRSRIKDAGCVQFGRWSIVEADTGDVFAGLKGGEPDWLPATPGNCHRTAWLAIDEVARLLDEVFTASPVKALDRSGNAGVVVITLPSPEIVAAARAVADRPKNATVALSTGYSVKRSPMLEVNKERLPNENDDDPGRAGLGEPDIAAACKALGAMKPADAAEILATGLDVAVLLAWVRLTTKASVDEGAAIVAEVRSVEPDAVIEAIDKLWSKDEWASVIEAKHEEVPDPQCEALWGLLDELRPAIDDARAGFMNRAVAEATTWLRRVGYDPRVNWICGPWHHQSKSCWPPGRTLATHPHCGRAETSGL